MIRSTRVPSAAAMPRNRRRWPRTNSATPRMPAARTRRELQAPAAIILSRASVVRLSSVCNYPLITLLKLLWVLVSGSALGLQAGQRDRERLASSPCNSTTEHWRAAADCALQRRILLCTRQHSPPGPYSNELLVLVAAAAEDLSAASSKSTPSRSGGSPLGSNRTAPHSTMQRSASSPACRRPDRTAVLDACAA